VALFLRIFQHLLPDGAAWRLLAEKKLRQLFEALAEVFASLRLFVDLVYEDRLPETTRELAEWERQFGLEGTGLEDARRLALAAEWKATGGQSPRYLQDLVQAAGFDVYIHEWWEPPNVAPRTVRNPRDYTSDPTYGTTQCGEVLAQCGEPAAQSNRFLANEPGYLVNDDLSRGAPPIIPDDPAVWPYFVYWGGATFGDFAVIDAARRAEFERLLLKVCPDHLWIVTMVVYEAGAVQNLFYFGGGEGFGLGQWGP
jgi:hypothetical protein